MIKETVTRVRKLTEQYAYTSIQMHETVGRRAGLTGTDHKYLGFLIKYGEMTAGDLAVHTGLTTGAVTGLVDRFEKKKLVKRQLSADDRRKVMIVPNTEKIMALLTPLYREFRMKSEEILRAFSPKDLKVLETYFTSAIGLMTETTESLNEKSGKTKK